MLKHRCGHDSSRGMAAENGFVRFQGTPGYIASAPLIDAVNCAIALERPLLLRGEPGTGKTILATHVAQGLGRSLIRWHIKSTSKAADGLYVYDTVQRLNDSRFGSGDVADIRHYIKLGPLGEAFAATEQRAGPVGIVTSNNAKERPDAFLRRCIFHYIEFPDVALMRRIVAVHHPHVDARLLDQILIKFYWLREQGELRKKPSTSELVDWISAIIRGGVSLDKIEAHLPFIGALLKKESDVEALSEFDGGAGRYPRAWADLGPRYNQ